MAGGMLFFAGCTYYGQAVRGGLEILCRKRSVERLLSDPTLDAGLRERLVVVREIRRFAVTNLGLPDNASYRSYADLGRPFVSWTVTAAPALSLEPREWCFPLAGCVTYRGYFSEQDAKTYAARLAAEGFDVDVGGVQAFSTLGWLADPVLNTFINLPEPDLAGLLFHELAHQVVYVKDDTTFNESFATTVEREGVRRWLEAQGRGNETTAYFAAQQREQEVVELLESTRSELAALYASARPEAQKLEGKNRILAETRQRYHRLAEAWGQSFYAGWFDHGLNNARLASWSAYHQQVPAFEALLAREGGDLRPFYEQVRRLARLPRERRLGTAR